MRARSGRPPGSCLRAASRSVGGYSAACPALPCGELDGLALVLSVIAALLSRSVASVALTCARLNYCAPADGSLPLIFRAPCRYASAPAQRTGAEDELPDH
ncbi:hypothetical protein ACFYW6_01255 [Streptomyces sp. NPDC002659]|uniref:hypothetical protein n=1 Tax=Streptomyces sp. NPDC002659 TaxID=3364656 RepID=UPI0036B4CF58